METVPSGNETCSVEHLRTVKAASVMKITSLLEAGYWGRWDDHAELLGKLGANRMQLRHTECDYPTLLYSVY